MKNDNYSDTLHKAMKDTSRPLEDDSSWNPSEEACDAGAQRKVDDRHINQLFSDMFDEMFGTAVALSRELMRDPDAETELNEESKY